jgi:hypothetical protein
VCPENPGQERGRIWCTPEGEGLESGCQVGGRGHCQEYELPSVPLRTTGVLKAIQTGGMGVLRLAF